MEAFLGQKRAATPADPSAALRAFFEVTPPAGTTAPSQNIDRQGAFFEIQQTHMQIRLL